MRSSFDLKAAHSFWLGHMYSRLGDQRRAADCAWRAINAATAAGDNATLGKAHDVLALEGHWAGTPTDGIAHGLRAVALLEHLPDQRWWLGMSHFYLGLNHILRGDFERAIAESGRAEAVGKDIGDPRLQTYAGFAVGWVDIQRGDYDAAIARCQRSVGWRRIESVGRTRRCSSGWTPGKGRARAGASGLRAGGCSDNSTKRTPPFSAGRESQDAPAMDTPWRSALASPVASRAIEMTQAALRAFQQANETFIRIEAPFEAARTRAELERAQVRADS